MAVYGIGAMYGGTDDKSEEFVRNGVACIGWEPDDAKAAHAQMKGIKAGDIIFIKSYAPNAGLHIKAVGVVTNAMFRKVTAALGYGVDVRWVPMPDGRIVLGPVEDHSDYMRRGSLYEEFNPDVIRLVLDVLVPPLQ
jgi:hypothetical protein